jgi:cytidylate kinase
MIIAIDGPAGAGKSSISQRVAEALGFQLLDTGAIYRSVAWAASRAGVAWSDAEGLGELAGRLEVRFALEGEINKIYAGLRGDALEDVTLEIRSSEMSQGASQVAAQPSVRAALLEVQRASGQAVDSVVEGRDIGTVVFPEAELKIFLTASAKERARRRRAQMIETAEHPASVPTVEELEAEIAQRDARDSQRAVAPLRAAEDAVHLDTTAMSPDDVVARIVQLARVRQSHLSP